MIRKEITFFGKKAIVACDENCKKAWGITKRPKIQISENEDDIAYLADNELDIAPEKIGTYEDNDTKPVYENEKLNKWCCRECERCVIVKPNEPIILKDFSKRVYNKKQ